MNSATSLYLHQASLPPTMHVASVSILRAHGTVLLHRNPRSLATRALGLGRAKTQTCCGAIE